MVVYWPLAFLRRIDIVLNGIFTFGGYYGIIRLNKSSYREAARVRLSIEEVRGELVRRVEEISGQPLLACNQCGKCSAGCPAAGAMDLLPNQVLRLAQLGLEEVLSSRTIWLCASCLTCLSRCPKGVDLPRVMEALRRLALRAEGDQLDLTALSPEFISQAPQMAIVAGSRKYQS